MPQIVTRNGHSLHKNWQKELADVITDPNELLRAVGLIPENYAEHTRARQLFALRVPRYFVSLMEHGNPHDPLLRQVMPLSDEFKQVSGYSIDPLEEQQGPAPGLLHKYHNRVLLIVRGGCAINCRYCFRRHFPYQDNAPGSHGWQAAIDYINERKQINEVIFSGGDPLMANDHHLGKLIHALETIPHLKRLRIHTRLPVVLPSRITPELISLLADCRLKTVVVTHVNHPNEVTEVFRQALAPLRQAGVWLLNQSVLLAKVNDDVTTLAKLSEALFDADIQPYYLHQLDKVSGAAHFDVPHERAVALMRQLHSELPGFLIPRLVREEAHKPSKTPQDLGLSHVIIAKQ
ncbi:EF-P beta-lysylation protein EpmB [Celerinatantimonas yamalensis]|uniref:L-lysine 2,3-aminomutase n=1 Tax=Celerinatantimonas yamalensis TaxID=559956 RepID=A0ABW9G5R2_9GAMM